MMQAFKQRNIIKRDIKRLKRRGKDLRKLQTVVKYLMAGEPLPLHYKDHPLIGNWKGSRDCHIEPDWILIYTLEGSTLVLERTGTHADLFGK